MNNQTYTPPQTDPTNLDSTASTVAPVLATRVSRLLASIIDGLITMIITVPIVSIAIGLDRYIQPLDPLHRPSALDTFLMTLFASLIFILIHGYFLIKQGQTLGKKIVRIKIVNSEDHLLVTKGRLLKRYGLYFFLGQIPVIGSFLSLVNILFIFGRHRECLHDIVAGTKVVKS